MARYKYDARTEDGVVHKGVMDASSSEDVVDSLHAKKLVVVKVQEDWGLSLEKLSQINIGGVPVKEKVMFMKQFATMISAGLPLTRVLEILVDQAENPKFKLALEGVRADVEGGVSISKALKKTSGIFSKITISLIAAGEESGALDTVLKRLAIELDKKKRLQDKVKSAFMYPALMSVMVVAVVVLMMVVLVPALKEIYGTFGDAELPSITLAMMSLSEGVMKWWWLIIIILSVVGVGVKYYLDTEKGQYMWGKISMRVPIFGKMVVFMQVAQFTRVLSLLLSSGLSILNALELTAEALNNKLFKDAVLESRKEIEKGVSLAVPLARSGVFPLIISQMVAVGEESGELTNVLEKMAKFYEDEVDVMASNMSTMLEPVMLIVMGGVIGIIAVAVYLPMFQLASVME